MKRLLALFLLISFIGKAQKSVLIYTHNGEGYVHKNIDASVKALTKICQSESWEVVSSNEPSIFDSEDFPHFDLVVFSNSNNEAFDTQAQKDAFQKYIQNGGGFMGIHSASGSERNWPWFAQMLGGKFRRHPPLQPFDIKVLDKEHPATSHLGDNWAWEDEFYYLYELNPDIDVLLAGDLSTVDDEKKAEYPGDVFGKLFPLSWSHTFDGGRQFYTALGHKSEYYEDENFIEHLKGGMKWVLKVE